MRVVLQRVSGSSVTVDHKIIGKIGTGFTVLLGIFEGDTEEDADYLAEKIVHLRVFEDDEGKMNRSLLDVGGELLIISQFTLCADCRKGRRPSFVQSEKPDRAKELYESFIKRCRKLSPGRVETGLFAADMKVEITNDGPVTLIIDTLD